MRLTYVLLSPTFGMHQYTADLANRMTARFEVRLVTSEHYPQDRYGPGVMVSTPVALTNTGLSSESLRVDRLKRVIRDIVNQRPDVVHMTGPHLWNAWLVRWLGRNGIPTVHTIHDLDPHHGASYGRLLYIWNRAIIRSADHIVVHGEKYRQRIVAQGIDPDKASCTLLTHLFVGHDMGRRLASGSIDVTYEPIVLFFGRQEPYKGLDTLLAAFDNMRVRGPRSPLGQRLRLIVAGPQNANQELVGQSPPGVEWRNRLIGDEEGVELFRRCSVVVLPYRDATQSAIVPAAYFFRKPVIVTDAGALPEYVEPGKTGLIVENRDNVEALAWAMREVMEKPGYKVTLGQAGRAWYDERRTRETHLFTELYQSVVH